MAAMSRGQVAALLLLLLLGLAGAAVTNCFSLVGESEWDSFISHNASLAAISLSLAGSKAAGSQLVTCLTSQPDTIYRILVLGDESSRRYLHPLPHSWTGSAAALLSAPPSFTYLIYGGRYRLSFTSCVRDSDCGAAVYSDYVSLQPEVMAAHCLPDGYSGNSSLLEVDSPAVLGLSVAFRFAFSPCSPVLAYEEANLTLYSSQRREECGTTEAAMVLQDRRPVGQGNSSTGDSSYAVIVYQTPELEGDRFYCLSASLSHISCHLVSVDRPNHCWLRSDPVWVAAVPPIGRLIPVCRSHLACGWLYIVVTGSLLLLLSLVLALLCLWACDQRTKAKARGAEEVDFCGEVVELGPVVAERVVSWAQLHAEWEARQDKARARILLLYSPDTKLFKELQTALKSFLQLACHADVYDLFDDALFDSIALDPSEWLETFVSDRDVKIIVISSIGAYRRQMALQGQMPLNLPANALLDGLFTSGLRFVSSYPGLAASGRVATARYELLHLTEEGHRLQPPVGGNREFLVPTQLHEVFCWLHQLQPLDLMGKPWDHYHLELQLLQDALKLARRDRTVVGSSGSGSSAPGLTFI